MIVQILHFIYYQGPKFYAGQHTNLQLTITADPTLAPAPLAVATLYCSATPAMVPVSPFSLSAMAQL